MALALQNTVIRLSELGRGRQKMWHGKETTGLINIARNKSKARKTPQPLSKRDNGTRHYNVKVLETNEQRVSK